MARTILLIDDSPAIRTLLRVFLLDRGFEFVEAADGAEGLERVRQGGVDLVVADVHMPRLDGISFVREIRRSVESWKDVPIVLLTSAKEARAEGMAAGASAFVMKPVSRGPLSEVIERLLPA